ncbi:MAG TPA: hypothetical protein VHB77_01305 [Planctomycetaceae bacterium]|nr:hypothetical protein [Planctomycetaceae bacterium]
MITACELAGFCAAHAIWCVSDGETLIPMLAHATADGEREMHRFAADDLRTAVETGKRRLADNEMDAGDAALLYDGFITLGNDRLDAVIIDIRCYAFPDAEAAIAVPYTPQSSGEFRVHKPKLLTWRNCVDFDQRTALQAFFNGVGEHEPGSKVWSVSLDESK